MIIDLLRPTEMCRLAPEARATVRCVISARATVIQSVCEWAEVGPDAIVGPFAHLTAGTKIEGPASVDQGSAGPGSAGPGSPVRQGKGEQGS